MLRKISAVSAFMISMVCLLSAQAPPKMPQPGPEQKRLGYFAGNWQVEGDMKPSPFGPGGKFTGTDHNEWLEGGFFLISHSDFKTPMGNGIGLSVFGYDPQQKVYTYHSFNSVGQFEHSEGNVQGDTWVWTSNDKVNGKTMKSRFTVKETSASAYTFKFEMAPEGGEFSTVMEGKASKVQ